MATREKPACKPINIEDMENSAQDAAALLRSLANEKRLMIVCQLVDGEKNVGELCGALDARQSTVSQQLALLRAEGVVSARKEAQTVYYSIADRNAQRIVELLYELFCQPAAGRKAPATKKSAVRRTKALA